MSKTSEKYLYKKALVIDDSDIDRFVASYNLKLYHFVEEVILKESAKSALEYLKNNSANPEKLPSIIFLDIRMPEMDGFQFLEEYGKLSEIIHKDCIVLMLSSSLDPNDISRSEANKFVKRFISKPLDREVLKLIEQLVTH